MNERTESALIIILIGTLFFILGGILLFDKVMMMAGNIVFSFGVLLLLKPQLNFRNRDSLKNISLFIVGVVLVFCKFAVLGFLCQLVSVLYTVRSKIPSLKSLILRNLTKILKFVKILN